MHCSLKLSLLLVVLTEFPCNSIIIPGAIWKDTAGVPIQAHGGGFLKQNGTYYWFGEDKTENNHHFINVNVYKSDNLMDWTFVAHALSQDDSEDSEIGAEAVVERPKVIYNDQTKQYVMWFHLDDSSYGLAKLGIATSSTVEGPYKFYGSVSPFGRDSRDMTAWVDDDGTGYVVFATRVNLDTVIAKLSPDYLSLEEEVYFFDGIHREAYALFKTTEGRYYMVFSEATGWASNRNHYIYSNSLSGPWSSEGFIAPDSSNTFNSQSNYVIPVTRNSFIFAGDRWVSNRLGDSRYMWQPIQFVGDEIKIEWHDQWSTNKQTGDWNEIPAVTINAASSPQVILSGSAVVVPCSGCVGGQGVGYVGNGDGRMTVTGIRVERSGSHTVVISYANGDAENRLASIKINGGGDAKSILFPSTGNGQATQMLTFEAEFQVDLDNTIQFYNDLNGQWAPDFDFVRILID